MNNFDRFILVVLVFNWVITAFQGNWDASLAWGVASGYLFLGTIERKGEK
jgi:hypothetical protein